MQKTPSGPSDGSDGFARYQFIDQWDVEGSAQQVFGIMTDFTGYPRWWPTYERITPVDGQGLTFDTVIRGRLPYRVQLRYRVFDVRPLQGWRVEAKGDLTGDAQWSMTETHGRTALRLDWNVFASRALLKYASLIIRPLLAWNHRHSMQMGERGLRAMLTTSRAAGTPT